MLVSDRLCTRNIHNMLCTGVLRVRAIVADDDEDDDNCGGGDGGILISLPI